MTRLLRALAVLLVVPAASAAAQSRFELQAAGYAELGVRNAAFTGSIGTGSGTIGGLDLSARYRIVGLAVRVQRGSIEADSGTTAAGRVTSNEIRAALGLRALSGELGYGRRELKGSLSSRTWSYVLVGVRGSVPLGATGFVGGAAVHLYVGARESGGASTAAGRRAETMLSYAPASAPLFFAVGYRIEQFTVRGGSADNPDELMGPFALAGVRVRL